MKKGTKFVVHCPQCPRCMMGDTGESGGKCASCVPVRPGVRYTSCRYRHTFATTKQLRKEGYVPREVAA